MTRLAICCLFAVVLGMAGCPEKEAADGPVLQSAPPKAQPPSAQPTAMPSDDGLIDSTQVPGRVHVVEPKDTLLRLSEKYYGNRRDWKRIWQANKKRISNPDDLPVGMKLIIP